MTTSLIYNMQLKTFVLVHCLGVGKIGGGSDEMRFKIGLWV